MRLTIIKEVWLWAAVLLLGGVHGMLPVRGADWDGSGLSDVWEDLYGGPFAPTGDDDGDGSTNALEYLFNKSPISPNSQHAMWTSIINGANHPQVTITGGTGLRYRIEISTNLQTWQDASGILTQTGASLTYTITTINSATQARYFWRVVGLDALDEDGDGLNAFEESLLGTSDSLASSDADSMPDGWEWYNGLNPLVDDAGGDLDGDGVINSRDSRANDASKGAVSFTIVSPGSGGIIP
jgi:hypothetical protein